MRPQPMIVVTDVQRSSLWYQQLLDCRSAHGGSEYERLVVHDSLILQLHNFHADHHHGPLADASQPLGNGALLWFETDDFDAAVARAQQMDANVVRPPHRNPPSGNAGPNHREVWLCDPDGYLVVVCSPDNEAAETA